MARRRKRSALIRTSEDIRREFERQCRIAALKEAAKVMLVAFLVADMAYAVTAVVVGM